MSRDRYRDVYKRNIPDLLKMSRRIWGFPPTPERDKARFALQDLAKQLENMGSVESTAPKEVVIARIRYEMLELMEDLKVTRNVVTQSVIQEAIDMRNEKLKELTNYYENTALRGK